MDKKAKILDLAMNLNRLGNWAADGWSGKEKRIKTFLRNANGYVQSLEKTTFPPNFAKTYKTFRQEYKNLEMEGRIGPKDPILWAERMMTWGNILTHRAKLLAKG